MYLYVCCMHPTSLSKNVSPAKPIAWDFGQGNVRKKDYSQAQTVRQLALWVIFSIVFLLGPCISTLDCEVL